MSTAVRITNDRLRTLLALLKGVKGRGSHYTARCPAHEDRTPSLSVTEGRDGRVLVKCHAGCRTVDVLRAVGLTEADLFPPRPEAERGDALSPRGSLPMVTKSDRRIVATYDYTDECGTLLYQVVRFEPKGFAQRRPEPGPDGQPRWTWGLGGDGETRRVLYRLPELVAAAQDGRRVYLVEGEKDADTLAVEGYVATTSPQGAGKWQDGFAEALRGAEVVILPDNDDVGRAHADQVAAACAAVGCPVRVVTLPDLPGWPLPPKADVTDWLDAGGTLDLLDARTEATPLWRAPRPASGRYLLADLWADPQIMTPPPAVVPYLAWGGRSTLLASAEKAGKSTLTGHIAAAVSRGGTFLDEPCASGHVLLVGLEEFIGDAARRLQQFRADGQRITLVDRLPGDPRERPRMLAAHIAAVQPALVVVDSLIAFSEGAVQDAGSSAQMGPLVQAFTTLAHDTGVAIIIIHHARKQDGKYRDSSAIGGAVDCICEMFAPDEDADPLKRELRARGRVPTRHVSFRLVADAHNRPTGYLRDHASRPRSLEERVVDYLAQHPGANSAAIRTAIGGRGQLVIDALHQLERTGRISDTGHGRPGPGGTCYRLTGADE